MSFISGYLGCVAITTSTGLTPKCTESEALSDINCSYHYSGKIFSSTSMTAVVRNGHGYAVITSKDQMKVNRIFK